MPSAPLRCVAFALALVGSALPVAAQGGFETLDPAYGNETARRAFYGGFALSGEAALRALGGGEVGAAPIGNLSLAARLDYAVLPRVDLALVADLTGAAQSGPLGLSWVVVKPYWNSERTDFALRLAVDPASEGGLGFRQTDVAFFSTTALSPAVTNDFSASARRVRTGYSLATEETTEPLLGASADRPADPRRERLVGQELRLGWGYNVLFDPAGSRLSLGLVAEGGSYSVVPSRVRNEAGDDGPPAPRAEQRRVRTAAGWLRAGIEFSRPKYQAAPFVSVPVVTWDDAEDPADLPGRRLQRIQFGLRLTLR
ncbi:hypothetical protein RQM47_01765 [Rubrivirga sp. S365]|uniref:Outer membrane protein beta-barrel domain-containing protein n=1 Tax=Rubrivirga litoralis TaxID=3075598 RepID=A0ABU3BPA5_9BACT|nr:MULTISPECIES: hypothetical protein [unclassified Rubrivirga]MDT0631126.1 hypothetical protein [Rubrivirga sp. F394]MDT7855361.1 hypothetical protein [Rubrivirga sp. S365]